MPLPRPPVRNMTDFVVFCFVFIVTTGLLISFLTIAGMAIFTDKDLAQAFGAMSDILTTLIGSLVGFIAGKSAAREEDRES